MKISDIDSSARLVDMENFFDVREDPGMYGSPYAFNLNSTIYFDGIPLGTYKLSHDMFWTTVSHEIYGTTRLWWVLMKVNGVSGNDIFKPVPAASTVRYVDKATIRSLLAELAGGGE